MVPSRGAAALLGAARTPPRLLRHRRPALPDARRRAARGVDDAGPARRVACARISATLSGAIVAVAIVLLLVASTDLIDTSPSRPGVHRRRSERAAHPSLTRADPADPRPSGGSSHDRRWCSSGVLSYGTYLWHWPVLLVLQEFIAVRPIVLAVIGGAISTGLAALSYEVFEMPIRRSAYLHRFRWTVPLVGVTASALVALLLMPPMLEAVRRPVTVSAGAPAATAGTKTGPRVPADLDYEKVSKDWGPEQSCTTPRGLHRGQGRRAERGPGRRQPRPHAGAGLREDRRGAGLPAARSTSTPRARGRPGSSTTTAPRPSARTASSSVGTGTTEVLPGLKPDLMILVSNSYDREERYAKGFRRIGGSDENLSQLLMNTTNETLGSFTKLGARSLVRARTRWRPAGSTRSTAWRRRRTRASAPSRRPWSPGPATPTTRSPTWSPTTSTRSTSTRSSARTRRCASRSSTGCVVWRDPDHITAQIGIHLRDKIWGAVRKTGVLDGLGFRSSS